MNWYALYVKSKTEKKVAQRLTAKGFEAFCPLKIVFNQWSDRKVRIEQPFFSSYVFVRFSLKDRLTILETPGVVNLVFWLKEAAVIKDKEMQKVISFFDDNKDKEISSEPYEIGQKAVISGGAFKDQIGIIVTEYKNKLILEMKQFQVSFSVEVDKENVRIGK